MPHWFFEYRLQRITAYVSCESLGCYMKRIELVSPHEISAGKRVEEITKILANAILRSHEKIKPPTDKVGLDILPEQSVHTNPDQQRGVI